MTKPTYTGPAHPIGYVELQTAWDKDTPLERKHELLAELKAKGVRENPGLEEVLFRLETVPDGAGREIEHIYVGFAPYVSSSEPLDPHNMNDAPTPKAGWPEPTDGILPLGSKERKF